MILTPIQLQLLEHSDKTLKFGCIIQQHPHIKKKSIYLGKETDEDSCMGSKLYYIFEERREPPYSNHPATYYDLDLEQGNDKIHNIYGHTFGRGRVCMLHHHHLLYLLKNKEVDLIQSLERSMAKLQVHFNKNPELYDQNCLERNEETSKLVLSFLESLSINK